ncbi:MAG: hypothetical protein CFH06_01930 [Alphaproteobacteria bacterium MarineAlpha3_Bin5]|nr:hypothetical protein [Magnetovibrio sp.]PPR75561.1 MAG: hypothetical protein CFH06_01930 [Alphaproteobacteria bacterium MarineAlpha3_Bin5]
MKSLIHATTVILLLSSCSGYVDRYEKHVEKRDQIYCYKSLAATTCYDEPYEVDDARLVNYFGPQPSRHERKSEEAVSQPVPPPSVSYWVKDPEPVPRAAPHGDFSGRPWLVDGYDQLAAKDRDTSGTIAFLKRIDKRATDGRSSRGDHDHLIAKTRRIHGGSYFRSDANK